MPERDDYLTVADRDGRASAAGVVVEDVKEVLALNHDDMEPLASGAGNGLASIAKLGDRLIVLLDSHTILAETTG
jgi:chemotaxis signal transduction protein